MLWLPATCYSVCVTDCATHRYVSATYTKYEQLLDGSAAIEVDDFLKSSDQELQQFGKVSLQNVTSAYMYIQSFEYLVD